MTSKIEWLINPDTGKQGYTINPVKGLCPMDCKNNQGKSYCYARRMYKRFRWNPEIRFDQTVFFKIADIPKGSKVFVGSTMELFGNWVKKEWLDTILTICRQNEDTTFIFLTKQPQNLPLKFPNNCWVGVSTTGSDSRSMLEDVFPRKLEAKVKFVSIEPLLDYSPMDFRWVDWVIAGQCTPVNKKTRPQNWAIDSIIENTKREGKPLFIKNNIISDKILNPQGKYNIQEFPIIRSKK